MKKIALFVFFIFLIFQCSENVLEQVQNFSPNTAPEIISVTSDSPGAGQLLPNNVIHITTVATDEHHNLLTFAYSSDLGSFSSQRETINGDLSVTSTITFVLPGALVPGFTALVNVSVTDSKGASTNYLADLGSGKTGPVVSTPANSTPVPPFMSQNSNTTISFVSDTNGFFQYRINNITGLSPTPDCTMNFVTDPFFFYDIAVTPVVNIDILGANYTGAGSGALFSLPVPAADAIYQVCVGVVDPLMQYTFLGGLQGILFTQDSVPPVTSFTTPPASYTAATNAPVTCSDNVSGCDLIAYTTSTSATPTPPAAPALPVIDPITHTVTAGALYSTPLVLADATQTTISALSLDLAGNPGTLQTASYIVDTTVPVITIDPASTSVISSVAGYDIASLTWSTNRINLNYTIKSGIDCATGTAVAGLAGVTPATANTNVTNLINAAQLAAGANTIWVCVDNLAALTGSSSHVITRDNTPPAISLTPLPGNFTTATNLVMSCTDTGGSTCAVTGYTKSTSSTTALPAAPTAPSLVVATKTVAAGTTQYTAPVALANATQTLVSYIAMDNVGNVATVQTTATPYIIETALPAVTVSGTTVNGISSMVLGANTPYDIATITWSTNRTNLNYTVKSGTCATGTPVANSTAMATPNLTGVTPATANTAVTTLINQADLVNGANSISICVTNLALNDGAANFTLNKDTTPPTVSISPAAGPSSSPLNFTITCSDAGVGCKDTNYYVNTAAASNYATGSTTTAGLTSSGIITHTGCPSTVYIVNYAARDNSMNLTTGTSAYTLSDCKVKINLAMTAPATYTGNSLSIKVDNATTLATSTSPIPATGVFTSTTIFKQSDIYNFSIVQQPAGQVCSVTTPLQNGTMGTADQTININCVNGYLVGGQYQALPPAPLNYHLYQGKVTTMATLAAGAISDGGLAFAGGDLFYVQRGTHQIFKCTAASAFATCTAFAGSDQSVAAGNAPGTVDGLGLAAKFYNPRGMISDGINLYVGQFGQIGPTYNANDADDAIRKIDMAGNVTTIISGTASTLVMAEGLAFDSGNIYIADRGANQIKKLNLATGAISLYAGTGTADKTGDSGTALSATFNEPLGLAVLNGILYICEHGNHQIRAINLTTNIVSTLTGAVSGAGGGFEDGPVAAAKFFSPNGIVTDGFDLYVSEFSNGRIRRIRFDRITKAAVEVTTIAGQGSVAYTAGTGINAKLNTVIYVASNGRSLYFTDGNAGGTGIIAKLSNNGLVGYWPLSGTGGNANDYNSDGAVAINGTLGSATIGDAAEPQTVRAGVPVTGRYGTDTAYDFDGGDYINFGNNAQLDLTAEYTISAWVFAKSAAGNQRILDKSTGGFYDGYLIDMWLNKYRFAHSSNDPVLKEIFSNSSILINQWVHLTATFSSSGRRARIYINGHLDAEQIFSTAVVTPINNLPFVIGASSGATGNFTGSIANVRIYNRALGEGEINELAQDAAPAQVGPSYNTAATGLLSHFSFDGVGVAPSLLDSGPLGIALTNAGTIGTATTAIGKDGDGNGAYSYVSANNQYLNGTDVGLPMKDHSRTMCAWINPASYPASFYNMIAVKYGDASSATGMAALGITSATVAFYSQANDAHVPYTVPLNTWSHLCATYSGSTTVSLYVNGQWIGSPAIVTLNTSSAATPALRVGSYSDSLQAWNGKIDDVRIYNNALTADQIRQLAVQVPTGLVARYELNNNDVATADEYYDWSGWGNPITGNSGAPTQTADRFATATSAYNFVKSNSQSLSVPDNANLTPTGDITLSAWVKPADLPPTAGNIYTIISKMNGTNGYALELFNSSGNQVIYLWSGGTAFDSYSVAYKLPVGVYSHVSATKTGTTATFYVNGAAIGTTSNGSTAGRTASSNPLLIGARSDGYYFNGSIDDVRVYNRALTANEIAEFGKIHPGMKTPHTVGGVTFNMNYVPGGLTTPTGINDATTATVANAYMIADSEVTYQLWNGVRTWATTAGGAGTGAGLYTFANAGNQGGDINGCLAAAVGTNQYPVTCINWRDAMVWTNALTEYYNAHNGTSLAVVYTSDAAYTTPIRSSAVSATCKAATPLDLTAGTCDNPYVNPNARGFRLPTGNEWELAGRFKGADSTNGAIQMPAASGYWWTPGSYASGATADTTSFAATDLVAWFGGVVNGSSGNTTTTQPVKTKTPNALGLYDMSGNMWEMDYDLFVIDETREYRGHSFGDPLYSIQVGAVGGNAAGYTQYFMGNNIGFRVARSP